MDETKQMEKWPAQHLELASMNVFGTERTLKLLATEHIS